MEEENQIYEKLERLKNPEREKKAFFTKEKAKSWLIGILIIVLVLTWSWPYLKGWGEGITGAFAADYSQEQGVERGSYFLGREEAPVKIIIFSDFQCPYCAQFSLGALPQLREEYVKSGKAKLIFKNLPLSFHQMAEPAAQAALCAGKQNKFWEYHDKLFENQGKLNSGYLRELAEELGLDKEEFNACLGSGEMGRQIQADQQAAGQARIRGTPAFLINGELLTGAQPFEEFKKVIEKKLGESEQK